MYKHTQAQTRTYTHTHTHVCKQNLMCTVSMAKGNFHLESPLKRNSLFSQTEKAIFWNGKSSPLMTHVKSCKPHQLMMTWLLHHYSLFETIMMRHHHNKISSASSHLNFEIKHQLLHDYLRKILWLMMNDSAIKAHTKHLPVSHHLRPIKTATSSVMNGPPDSAAGANSTHQPSVSPDHRRTCRRGRRRYRRRAYATKWWTYTASYRSWRWWRSPSTATPKGGRYIPWRVHTLRPLGDCLPWTAPT